MNDKDTREMDVDAEGTSVLDEGTRVDLDGEVTGSDGSGGMGEIRRVLCPPPIADVDDWGIPPESQQPCDPEVEVGGNRVQRDDAEKIGSLIVSFLFSAGKADAFPYP